MSFFIDETHLFSGLGAFLHDKLKSQFKDQPDYQFRDDIENAIDEKLPNKHTISVDGSKIKVELFHSNVNSEELAKIEKVINDTFKVCTEYNMVPKDVDTNFRMFLFEDREQYVDILKSSYNYDAANTAGITSSQKNGLLTASDVLIYQGPKELSHVPFDDIDYFTLAHEFVHCIQNVVERKGYLSTSVTEGMADAFAGKALGQEIDALYDREIIQKSIKALKSDNAKFSDMYYGSSTSDFSKTEDYHYIIGTAIFKFLSDKNPKMIQDIVNYSLTGNMDKFREIWDYMHKVDNCDKFTDWLDDQCNQYHCMEAII
ncbi:MAG: hypothetical protein sL5_07860 [Candidatus Mesenet longicola]|uniref:Uncharacterized protein n=1 Tax=Candidatus Mesenet longicola TaxID=1892558 RepID=A0A8J3MP91_9RICK|nr:MAG: hypothetical protein sGL2_08600 [Candidatus Mesenet longicola]GHM59793.1 MAG: hypothetical protein sL5_07860 [Candidatus Mesenet longicola]